MTKGKCGIVAITLGKRTVPSGSKLSNRVYSQQIQKRLSQILFTICSKLRPACGELLENQLSAADLRRRYECAPPLGPISFLLMLFSAKVLPNNNLGLSHPTPGNPGSATCYIAQFCAFQRPRPIPRLHRRGGLFPVTKPAG